MKIVELCCTRMISDLKTRIFIGIDFHLKCKEQMMKDKVIQQKRRWTAAIKRVVAGTSHPRGAWNPPTANCSAHLRLSGNICVCYTQDGLIICQTNF